MRAFRNAQEGFTLIEVMVTLAILGIVLTGVMQLFLSTGKYHTSQEMFVTTAQDVRAAKHLMVYELRGAGCNPDNLIRMGLQLDPADDRLNTDANSVHFLSDLDNGDNDSELEPDGDADDPDEDVSFYRVSAANPAQILNPGDPTPGILIRNAGGVEQEVMGNVVDLAFTYFDQSNNVVNVFNTTTSLDTIRSVQVVIVGQVENPGRVNPANRTWRQQFTVKLRNT